MFTARNRQNPFAKRRRAQAEAEAAPYDENKSPEHTETPDIATLATGGLVEPPADETAYLLASEANAKRLREAVTDFPPSEEQTTQANVVLAIPVETQAKIDAVMSHAIPPVELHAEVDETSLNAPLPDAENVEREAPAVVEEPKRGRGRPRPQATIDRDNAVHALLVGANAETGISKESLAAELGEKEQQVYSSLRQLTKEGRAETRYVKPHGYRWFAVAEAESA